MGCKLYILPSTRHSNNNQDMHMCVKNDFLIKNIFRIASYCIAPVQTFVFILIWIYTNTYNHISSFHRSILNTCAVRNHVVDIVVCMCRFSIIRDCRHRSTSINVRLKIISDDDRRIVPTTAAAMVHNASVTINEDGRVRRSEVADSYR